jgi:hypothetical protein
MASTIPSHGRPIVLLVASLLVVSTVLTIPVGAQSDADADSNSGPCSGLPIGADWICDGLVGVIEWFIGGMGDLVQGMMVGVVEFIVDTPRPYSNGEMALLEQPDNQPWRSLHDLYLTKTLPIGLAFWGLIALLTQFTRLFTHSAAGEAQQTRLTRRAAFGLLMLIAWWPIGAFVLHMAGALTTTIAPTGQQMVGSINEFFANIGGGLITAILIYFSAGVLAILLLILFISRYVAIYVLMPLMPVLIALWIVDEGPMKYIANVASSIGGMFVPFAFLTIPTAAILLVGYTIQDALRQSLGSLAILPGISGGETTAYAFILFTFWVMALIAPLFVLFGGRAGLPIAYLTAGYIAGHGLSGIARRGARGLRNARASAGTGGGGAAGAAGSTAGSGAGPQLPAPMSPGSIRTPEQAVGGVGNGSTPSGAGADPSVGYSGVGSISGSGAGGARLSGGQGEPWDEISGEIDPDKVRSRITPDSSFDEKLPDDRRYTFGYSKRGDFEKITPQDNLTKADIIHQKYPRLSESGAYSNKSDMYLRDDEGHLYDVTPQWHYDRQHRQFNQEAREVVFDAREYGFDSASTGENTKFN